MRTNLKEAMRLASLKREMIYLKEEDWREFLRQLDNPGKPNQKLIDLLKSKPIWEK